MITHRRIRKISGIALLAVLAAAVAIWAVSNTTSADQDEHIAPGPGIVAAARGTIDVEGGLLRLSTQRDGIIREVKAIEGQRVKQGDIVAALDNRHEVIAVRIAEAEVLQGKSQLDMLRAKLNAQERQLQRIRRAEAGKAVSAQTLDEAHAQLEALKAEIAIAQATLSAAESRADNSRLEVEMRLVRAPIDARVIRRSAKVGEVVSTQALTELFTLLPEAPLIVRAEIQEQFVDLIMPGMSVDIVSETDDSISVQGKVVRIGNVLEQPRNRDAPGDRVDVRSADCVISVPQSEPFLIGQRVFVRFRT